MVKLETTLTPYVLQEFIQHTYMWSYHKLFITQFGGIPIKISITTNYDHHQDQHKTKLIVELFLLKSSFCKRMKSLYLLTSHLKIIRARESVIALIFAELAKQQRMQKYLQINFMPLK